MNKSVFGTLAVAVALCGCHQNAENRQGTGASGIDNGGTPITIVGCLVPGGAGSQTGTVGTTGDTAPAAFTLVDVTTTSGPTPDAGAASGISGASGMKGASGTSGTPAVDTGTPRSYNLVGYKKQSDLQKYQNSKVEVTGVLVASTDSGAGVPDVGAASAPAGNPQTEVQRVRVNKIRQLDSNCNGTNQRR
jgi:hypothetical protein